MRHVAAFLAIVAALLFGVYTPTATSLPGSVVKIVLPKGHGSGVHIGDGYVITAAHVVGVATGVTVKLDDSTEQPAEVLWANKAYDVALIRTADTMRSAPLQCRTPSLGEHLSASGNPLGFEFINTEGRVAGAARHVGTWKLVVPVDMTIIMGMSGGPVFDARGNVVGISIGVALVQLGISPSLTGIGFIVPGKTICDPIARR